MVWAPVRATISWTEKPLDLKIWIIWFIDIVGRGRLPSTSEAREIRESFRPNLTV